MIPEYNPSFEDMYPINEDALYEDFYDALVKVVYGIKNLLENDISTSSVWELACTLREMANLGMPKSSIVNERHRKAWKKMLLLTDNTLNLLDFQNEQDAYQNKLLKKGLDGMFYAPEDERYKNSKAFSNWDEQKDYIKD